MSFRRGVENNSDLFFHMMRVIFNCHVSCGPGKLLRDILMNFCFVFFVFIPKCTVERSKVCCCDLWTH